MNPAVWSTGYQSGACQLVFISLSPRGRDQRLSNHFQKPWDPRCMSLRLHAVVPVSTLSRSGLPQFWCHLRHVGSRASASISNQHPRISAQSARYVPMPHAEIWPHAHTKISADICCPATALDHVLESRALLAAAGRSRVQRIILTRGT